MIDFLNKYGWNKYSQNNEDGVIQEVLKRIGLTTGVCIEFGGADGYFCSNIRLLMDNGWQGLQFDINPAPGVIQQMITPENVTKILGHHVNVLSIDIDGNDYKVWEAYKAKPEVVIIEVNSSYSPEVYHFSKETGCSYALMNLLGEQKGYFLLCHTGNMIFVDKKFKKLFPEINLDPIINHSKFFNSQWLH